MRRCQLVWVSLGVVLGVLIHARCGAQPSATYDAIQFGVGIGGGTRDGLSISDVRPVTRGELVGTADISVALDEMWSASVAGHLGGSWFDFKQEFATSGNMKDQMWSGGISVSRFLSRPGKVRTWIGLGAEYGEARSWTDTRLFSDAGPRVSFVGGGPSAGVAYAPWQSVKVYGELATVMFKAHGRDASSRSDYNWLGHLSRASFGVRIGMGQRRGSNSAVSY